VMRRWEDVGPECVQGQRRKDDNGAGEGSTSACIIVE
jgi:hypothetical protein